MLMADDKNSSKAIIIVNPSLPTSATQKANTGSSRAEEDVVEGEYVFIEAESPPSTESQNWSERFIFDVLRRYAKNASADFLIKKYPGLPKNIIAERYIKQQAWAAAIAGGVSAAIVSGVIVLTGVEIVSTIGIPALGITLPVGILTFGGELYYTLRLQIKTAFDLCNLYGVEINLDDPEDLQDIFALGMGIKAGEITANALQRIAPKIAEQQARKVFRQKFFGVGFRSRIQKWAEKGLSREIARRYLSEGFLLKAVVPGLSIVLGAGWNYFSTVNIGKAVEVRARLRGYSIDQINQIALTPKLNPNLALATALVVLTADNRLQENELVAYKQLAMGLKKLHPDFVPQNIESQWADRTEWFAKLAEITDVESQQTIFSIAETIAILDGNIGRDEIKLLKEVAKIFGIKFDEQKFKLRAKPFYVAPAGRGCQIAAIVILVSLLLSMCACSVSVFMFANQFMPK